MIFKGEIWWIDFKPSKGSEQNGRRPAVVISGDLLNKYAPVIYVCPLTTKIKNYKGDVVLNPNNTNNLKEKSEVLVMHLRSVSKDRLESRIGKINTHELTALRQGVQDLLLMD